jgi:parvulin-like peptidyl-prolyl isomerase
LGWLAGQWAPGVVAQSQPTKPPDAASAGIHVEKPEIVAIVNGVPISRQELGEEMIARHGKHQLDLLINRRIIHMAAQRAGITVTDAEVEEDVQEVMKLGKFRTPKEFEDHFLKKEKNCTLYEYKEDVIRPGLMMKKMADKRLQISEEEIRKEFEARYGERVQCCIVYEQDQKVIHSIYAEIIRSDNMVKAFMDAAKKQSNLSLATCAGRVNPIGRNTTSKNVEDRAFLMQDGEISEVLGVPGGFVILMREHPVPADKDKNLDQERATIRREIVDKKMRTEVPKLFQELKKSAQVQDFLNKKFAGSFTDVIEDQASESSASKRNK